MKVIFILLYTGHKTTVIFVDHIINLKFVYALVIIIAKILMTNIFWFCKPCLHLLLVCGCLQQCIVVWFTYTLQHYSNTVFLSYLRWKQGTNSIIYCHCVSIFTLKCCICNVFSCLSRQLSVKNWKWFSVTSENIFVIMYISSFVGLHIVMCEG